jgi:diguanylate cyclase (GGDEF)-like protein
VASQTLSPTVRSKDESISQSKRWRWPSPADPAILERLSWIQNVCLAIAGTIAAAEMCGWLIPSSTPFLFTGWMLMKANTALLSLLSVSSLVFSKSGKRFSRPGFRIAGQVLALMIVLVAAAVLIEYLGHISIGVDTMLTADAGSPYPGRMSPQTASAFAILGIVLLLIRVVNRRTSLVIDLFAFCLCPLVMFIVSGYVYGVMHLIGVSSGTRTSPQTLLSLMLLSLVALSRRAETGVYSVLAGAGIGSKIARFVAPLSLVLPFALETTRLAISQTRVLSPQFAMALVTALAAVLGLAVILILAWRIDILEQEIRELSIRDDLTHLYNRRGFFLLAERELRTARRANLAFSVLFLDLDGLKQVNDKLGHDIGSEFLKETAAMINLCFRESDVVARVGGDEFVVAGVAAEPGIFMASQRLQRLADDRNARPGNGYLVEFSLGMATFDQSNPETLEELVKRADQVMYLAKRSKGQSRA